MTAPNQAMDRITDGGVIAVMRGITDETVTAIGDALVDGGITAVEVTADTPGVTGKIERLADRYPDDGTVVGAGTVLDAPTARQVLLAGAEFIVTPTVNEAVIQTANRYGVPVLPGAFTPTEALTAMEAGADAVKIFPASSAGPGHVSAIKGPLGQVPVVPTGGVSRENGADYIAAGATALGVGSALVTDELVAGEDWAGLEDRAREFVELVAAARS